MPTYSLTTLRKQCYHILEDQRSSLLAKLVNLTLMLLISLNIIAVMLESELALQNQDLQPFFYFETFSVLLFSLEYLARVWSIVESEDVRFRHPLRGRLRYMLTPIAIVDLLAILPFYLSHFLSVNDLLVLRSLRLLRVLKLTRYSQSMDLLAKVIRQESAHMLSALSILCVLILLAATGIYLVEGTQQPEVFGSIPRAIWWATVTLTTVGYGDTYPLTLAGKIFSGMTMICGIAVAALPAAILASGLINELDRRREDFRGYLLHALEDGVLETDELLDLEKRRVEIGMSRSEARRIFKEMKQLDKTQTYLSCPHCHQGLMVSHPGGHIHVQTVETKTVATQSIHQTENN